MNKLTTTLRFKWRESGLTTLLRVALFSMLCFMGFALAVTSVKAHEGASGIIKQRMDAMKSMGDYAKTVGDMFKGKATFDLSVIRTASQAFIRHGQTIPAQFPDTPESRKGSMSEALPAIWDDWQQFTALAEQFTRDSRQLDSVIAKLQISDALDNASTRNVRAAFFKAVKNCSDCHELFRLERE